MDESDEDVIGRQALRTLRARAQKAADTGDSASLFMTLCEAGLLDGTYRWIASAWSRLGPAEIETVIAKAVDETCKRVHEGKRIKDVFAYVSKTAWTVGSQHNAALDGWERVEQDSEEAFIEAERRRREGAKLARRFLPQVGKGQVRAVMTYLVDCIEMDQTFDAQEAAEMLDVPVANIPSLISRGCDRLQRLARNQAESAALVGLAPDLSAITTPEVEE